jgi:DNA-binding IclR family transcriptional regulator
MTRIPAVRNDDDLRPSCRCALLAFEATGERTLSRQELLDETGLAERTLTRALHDLQSGGYLSLDRENDDLRQVSATLAATHTLNPSQSDT